MDINITLFGEMLTFMVLLWVMGKYIWPQLTKAIEKRQQQIVEGVEAAKKGHKDLAATQQKIAEQLQHAKDQAAIILEQAQQKSVTLIEQSRAEAQQERNKVLAQVEDEIKLAYGQASVELQQYIAELAVAIAEKAIKQNFDDKSQDRLINKIIAGI
jgi:F-type H+-transporting ATPase subunit b